MIRFGLQQIITLDMDEVLRPNGETGVYLQSAHARANSILRRCKRRATLNQRGWRCCQRCWRKASGNCCDLSMSIRAAEPRPRLNWHHMFWRPTLSSWPRTSPTSTSIPVNPNRKLVTFPTRILVDMSFGITCPPGYVLDFLSDTVGVYKRSL